MDIKSFLLGLEKWIGVHAGLISALYTIMGVWQLGICFALMALSLLAPRDWLPAPWGRYYCLLISVLLAMYVAAYVVPVMPWQET